MTDDLLSDWSDVGHPHVDPPATLEWEVNLLDENSNGTFRVPAQPILEGLKVRLSGVVFRGIPPAVYDRYRVYYRGVVWRTCGMDRFNVSSTDDEIRISITLNLEST